MKTTTPAPIYLRDYKRPEFHISDIYLTFELDDSATQVRSEMVIEAQNDCTDLFLDGEELKFKAAWIDGKKCSDEQIELSAEGILIRHVPRRFTLVIENEINPEANKALDGLYKSGEIFCTQCEPEGFRRITYYLDRPDIMAKFKTKIIADQKKYPFLLSNGNPIEKGKLADGRHWVCWEDPFLKPCYLFALVAGDFALVEDHFKTRSGRQVLLQIFVDKGNEDKCTHAMESLKNSMKWDEDRFGLEYDLDIYMIVAVDSFNMGAMENKGLNIFNSTYVLAKAETATDDDFMGIESVIGHEYFHNWTGNRVTCRDWFQLTLKEGLTVFRDQEFSADMNSATTERIVSVNHLKELQFAEDAGPTSHPIKPDSYIEINNFYTMTIYEKGAEVIRMIHTLLGEEKFRAGMDLYFELYDGQAVTTEDFIHAMSKASGEDLEQFKRWYSQAGTPCVTVDQQYNQDEKRLTLTLTQKTPATPGQANKLPFYMPIRIGLLDQNGQDMPLICSHRNDQKHLQRGLLVLKDEQEIFTFDEIEQRPILSFNRNFSAPIYVKGLNNIGDELFLMAHDNDPFNRFESAQKLAVGEILKLMASFKDAAFSDQVIENYDHQSYLDAYQKLLLDSELDGSVKAESLTMPSVKMLQLELEVLNHQSIFKAREALKRILASRFEADFLELYRQHHNPKYSMDAKSMSNRALKNTALSFLMSLGKEEYHQLCFDQFCHASNMTDEQCALSLLSHYPNSFQKKAQKSFYDKWKHETLVMQKWLMAQASSPLDETFDRIQELEKDAVFDLNIPNLVRSLVGSFARNSVQFHHPSGRGYRYLADKVLILDKLNPQVSSALCGAFRDYKKLEDHQRELMRVELERIAKVDDLSKNAYEIINKILA